MDYKLSVLAIWVTSGVSGCIGAAISTYVISRFKETAKIDSITKNISEVLDQKYLIKNKEESAKIDAITKEIDKVLEHQKSITIATETIKSNVDLSNWLNKENRALRREKIEQLYLKIEESLLARTEYLYPSDHEGDELEQIKETEEKYKIYLKLHNEIKMIIQLYFNVDSVLDSELNKLEMNYNKTTSFSQKYLLKEKYEPKPAAESRALQNEYFEISKSIIDYLINSMRNELIES
ncbi:hypothetical protein [Photobacterium leiognathi]|uniref:hypothetical protein n=1 Tax=Photobacterium leiognathi TaxID=553611 RepID=UPI00298102A3|nr:hypothetical protein [Photobacterium leiognathi]